MRPVFGSPFGSVDAVTAAPNKVTASGWVIEPDNTAAISVQMYIEGSAKAAQRGHQLAHHRRHPLTRRRPPPSRTERHHHVRPVGRNPRLSRPHHLGHQ